MGREKREGERTPRGEVVLGGFVLGPSRGELEVQSLFQREQGVKLACQTFRHCPIPTKHFHTPILFRSAALRSALNLARSEHSRFDNFNLNQAS